MAPGIALETPPKGALAPGHPTGLTKPFMGLQSEALPALLLLLLPSFCPSTNANPIYRSRCFLSPPPVKLSDTESHLGVCISANPNNAVAEPGS